jgi:hypothetical protein
MFFLTPAVPYSSEVQQPRHATAILDERPQAHRAASYEREQDRAKVRDEEAAGSNLATPTQVSRSKSLQISGGLG